MGPLIIRTPIAYLQANVDSIIGQIINKMSRQGSEGSMDSPEYAGIPKSVDLWVIPVYFVVILVFI